ncbi:MULTISPECIES: PLDc N-terminal domain-containing protein [unclassified Corynebacterium]|uniref:PLDc N-terminal domain-containing protein n=1 Tax=unclassified Corynebacterium TaxID=2624378 RepID=UPI0026479DD1|nr:PLDc N-terminal domain-containing protein [Corynebacterium sp.]MDN5721338.1 PLDc N-terminal domain-containing protein [Corynebacterium sp.]MDN6324227.1 PLDc N-terminal domain-containing protein [Corynebacterium sp.]
MRFWDIFWLLIYVFFLIAYLTVLFQVITDLFRDRDLGSGWKAVWIIFLILVPLITALVYLVIRGRGMAERQRETQVQAQQGAEDYIRHVAGSTSPSEQISTANQFLKDGVITSEEFDRIKAKALS